MPEHEELTGTAIFRKEFMGLDTDVNADEKQQHQPVQQDNAAAVTFPVIYAS